VRRIRRLNQQALDRLPTVRARWDRLCELNVIEQAIAVAQTSIIRGSWSAGREIALHGWIYDLADGQLRDLNVTVTSAQEADELHARTASAVGD